MRLSSVLGLLVAALLLACGGSGADSAKRPLPSYAGHGAELFDDSIEPRGVGLDLDLPTDPKTDAWLRERTQTGDAALRVRVSTVTEKDEDSGTRYILGLSTVEKLAGVFPPSGDFSVTVGKSNMSNGIVRGLQGRLMGKTFVAFVRLFVRADGDRELHFHLAPDNPQEVAAVRAAATDTKPSN
jgi:hypothetical protein